MTFQSVELLTTSRPAAGALLVGVTAKVWGDVCAMRTVPRRSSSACREGRRRAYRRAERKEAARVLFMTRPPSHTKEEEGPGSAWGDAPVTPGSRNAALFDLNTTQAALRIPVRPRGK